MSKHADASREARWKARGHGRLTMRLSGNALRNLDLLAAQQNTTRRDALEALLLGTVAAPHNPHRMSASEMDAARELGVSL